MADLSDQTNSLGALELVAEFDRYISQLSFGEIVKGALAFATEHLVHGRASVALLLPNNEGFRLFDAKVDVKGMESGKVIPFESASLAETVRRSRAIYRPDIRLWPTKNVVDEALLAGGFVASLSIPLVVGGRCIGTLNFAVKQVDGIVASVRHLVQLIAPRLAFALEMGKANEAFAESEARFRDVFDTVADGIVVADISNRRLVMVNSAICAMIGRNREELMECRINDIHPIDSLEETVKTFEAMVRGEIEHALQIPVLRADGSQLLADVTARKTVIDGKHCVVGVFRDATTRRACEAEQLQLQKLESIRTLAAGLAHDFNNLLTGLVGNVSLAQELLEPSHEVRELLDLAQEAATRATALTRQLLTFAKGGAPVRGKADLAQILRRVVQEASGQSGATFELLVSTEDCVVLGDEGQLFQVFHNLIRNAAEAMPTGGKVLVGVLRCFIHGREELCVEVRDEGPGIPADQLPKIFLPFFTTKDRGSGLGLAVAYSIVQNHNGAIEADSKPGLGTTFRVTLPLLVDRADSKKTMPISPSPAAARILVMDDEAIVRQVAARALGRTGFQVLTAINGTEAVAAYADAVAQGSRIDAVILDLTVRDGMGGKEAAMRIQALDPTARLIVSSGYSDDAIMSDYRSHGFCAVLPKPYSASQLCEMVSIALAGVGGERASQDS